MSSISGLAQVIYDDLELGETSILSLSGWLENNIGKLNIMLDECYSSISGDFDPSFTSEVSGIYQEVYRLHYYKKQIQKAVNGISTKGTGSAVDWVELREGDSLVKRANPSELAKVYASERSAIENNLKRLVSYYHSNRSKPQQIVGNEWEEY
jgi:hypothetical protein